ncbi:flagellar hook-length control protein FliK [Ammoniphilus sp. 3BR4]|uniref:flagellar hook-length control protein FliK n=1 Tax=Ammoniphilus sp. 3BR4 TaxID=3158265 RepID=UPI003466DED8
MSMAEQLFLQPMQLQDQGPNLSCKIPENNLFSGLLQQEKTKLNDMSLKQEVLEAVDDLLASFFNLTDLIPKSPEQLMATELSVVPIQDLTKRLQTIKLSIQKGEISDISLNKLQHVLDRLTQNLSSIESSMIITDNENGKEELMKIPSLLGMIERDFSSSLEESGERIKPLVKNQEVHSIIRKHSTNRAGVASEQLTDISESKLTLESLRPLHDSIGVQPPMNPNSARSEVREGDLLERQVPIQWLSKHLEPLFARNVFVRNGQQVQEMILQLQPDSLGKLDVMIQTQNGQLTAKFIVENQVAKQAVEEQIQHLRHNLQLQGVTVHNLEVVDSSSNNYLPFQQHQRHNQEQKPFYSRGKKNKEYTEMEEQLSNMKLSIQSRDEIGINYTV